MVTCTTTATTQAPAVLPLWLTLSVRTIRHDVVDITVGSATRRKVIRPLDDAGTKALLCGLATPNRHGKAKECCAFLFRQPDGTWSASQAFDVHLLELVPVCGWLDEFPPETRATLRGRPVRRKPAVA